MPYNSTAGTGNDLDLARAVEVREPIQSGHACASLYVLFVSVLFVSVLSVTVCSLPLSLSLPVSLPLRLSLSPPLVLDLTLPVEVWEPIQVGRACLQRGACSAHWQLEAV